MKILYYALVATQQSAGPIIRVLESCKAIEEFGHKVRLLVPRPQKRGNQLPFNVKFVPFYGFSIFRIILSSIVSFFSILQEIRNFKPDILFVVESLNPFLFIITKICKVPYCIELNGFAIDDMRLLNVPGWQILLTRLIQKITLHYANCVVTSTPGLIDKVQYEFGISPEKMIYMDSGVDLTMFLSLDRKESCRNLGYSLEYNYITYIGSFHPHHDLFTFIKSMAIVCKKHEFVRGFLIGDGFTKVECEKLAEKLGIKDKLFFTGFVPHNKIPQYLSISSIGILPLIKRKLHQQNGAFAMKLYEYWACKVPVILTDVPASITSQQFKDAACAVLPEDPTAMAEGIMNLLEDHNKRESIIYAGRKMVEQHFSWKKQIELLLVQISTIVFGKDHL